MTIEILRNRLEMYLEAESAILKAQSYRIGDRELSRADLADVRAIIDDLAAQIDALTLKHGRVKRVVLYDI